MEQRYSIDGQILTDIADVIREKVGKSEGVPAIVEAVYEFSDQGNNSDSLDHASNAVDFSFHVPGASYVLVKDIVITADTTDELYFKIGYYMSGRYNSLPEPAYRVGSDDTPKEIVASASKVNNGLFFVAVRSPIKNTNINISLTAIGMDENQNVLVNKEVILPYGITPEQMPDEIRAIETGNGDIPEEAFMISGDCTYKFSYTGWNWFIENYGSKITTNNITGGSYMFYQNTTIQRIPFELNFDKIEQSIANLFSFCENLLEIPKMSNIHPNNMSGLFRNCYRLRHIPEDIDTYFVWDKVLTATSAYSYNSSAVFAGCYSLRNIPEHFLGYCNPVGAYSTIYLYSGFENCYALDELVGLPLNYTAAYTSNMFYNAFNNCYRLRNITFAMPDGQPHVMRLKSQVIDLTKNVGYASSAYYFTTFNSGITADKEVKDDATYQALKDDPDWFTCKAEYSRYNHDSAVATINSLPDTSAYLATAGGTNTIKFKGSSGSGTDGGAVNTLTAEEIAVATARGWTITFA